MSLLSFLGASLTGTSLLLRGFHGAFSFRKGWPASLHPIPPPPFPIRTDKPASHLGPFRRGPHDVPTLPTYHLLKKSPWPRAPVEWKFVGVVEHGHSIRLKLSNVIEGNGNEDHVRLGRQHTSAINHRSRFIRRLHAPLRDLQTWRRWRRLPDRARTRKTLFQSRHPSDPNLDSSANDR